MDESRQQEVCLLDSEMSAAGQPRRGIWVGIVDLAVIRKGCLECCVGQATVMSRQKSKGSTGNIVGYIRVSKVFGHIKVKWKPLPFKAPSASRESRLGVTEHQEVPYKFG